MYDLPIMVWSKIHVVVVVVAAPAKARPEGARTPALCSLGCGKHCCAATIIGPMAIVHRSGRRRGLARHVHGGAWRRGKFAHRWRWRPDGGTGEVRGRGLSEQWSLCHAAAEALCKVLQTSAGRGWLKRWMRQYGYASSPVAEPRVGPAARRQLTGKGICTEGGRSVRDQFVTVAEGREAGDWAWTRVSRVSNKVAGLKERPDWSST